MRRIAGRRGYSLLEMLTCIALLGLLFPAASKFYIAITRLHQGETNALDRVAAFDDLEHDFRAAAARASGVETGIGAFKTSDTTVVLRLPQSHVVFTATPPPAHPQRIVLTQGNDGVWQERITNYRMPQGRCRFSATPGGASAEFFAHIGPDSNRQGEKTPGVHLLAALRSGGVGGTPQ